MLILIVTSTREWKVEVGYGLEGVITPTFLSQVATDYVVPYLEQDDYGEGVYNMALFIGAEIEDRYQGSESGDPAFPIGWIPLTTMQWVLVIIGLVALTAITKGRIWLLLFFVLTLGRGGGGFGGGRSGGAAEAEGSDGSRNDLCSGQQPLTNLLLISQKVRCDRCP